MRLLLQKGAAVEAIDDSSWTPLHLCTERVPAQILLDHGADVDCLDKNGLTPLHHAVSYKDVELFATFYENGASTLIRAECDGRQVLDMIEDLEDQRVRDSILAVIKGASSGYRGDR